MVEAARSVKKAAPKRKAPAAPKRKAPAVTFAHGNRVEISLGTDDCLATIGKLLGRDTSTARRVKLIPQRSGETIVELSFDTAHAATTFATGG